VRPLLDITGLRVAYGSMLALDRVSCSVQAGGALGIVGAEGSGKTVAALTILGLTRRQGAAVAGRIEFDARDLVSLPERELRQMRGAEIALLSSLHPFYTVGRQLVEAIRTHRRVSKPAARDRAIDLLELVGIPDPHTRVDAYPHELPDVIRFAATTAMAVANEPKLLIVDEPGANLDVTARERILELLEDVHRRLGSALIVLTRDPRVAGSLTDELYSLSPSSST
jgi:peptide/nickel transport system ATP-binding protein